jgi:hypothetical protein
LYASQNIVTVIKSRTIRWEDHVTCMGQTRNTYNILGGKPEVKRPPGRPRHRWKGNIRMDLGDVG